MWYTPDCCFWYLDPNDRFIKPHKATKKKKKRNSPFFKKKRGTKCVKFIKLSGEAIGHERLIKYFMEWHNYIW